MQNKPGTVQVGAISKAQKDENHFFYNWRQQKLSTKLRKNIPNFFGFFLKFPVSRIVPKNVKGWMLWDFLNIHSVATYQKLMGGTIKKISEKISLTVPKKGGKSHSVEKSGPSALEWLFISC